MKKFGSRATVDLLVRGGPQLLVVNKGCVFSVTVTNVVKPRDTDSVSDATLIS